MKWMRQASQMRKAGKVIAMGGGCDALLWAWQQQFPATAAAAGGSGEEAKGRQFGSRPSVP